MLSEPDKLFKLIWQKKKNVKNIYIFLKCNEQHKINFIYTFTPELCHCCSLIMKNKYWVILINNMYLL